MDARIALEGGSGDLAGATADRLREVFTGDRHETWRRCSLAALHTASEHDDVPGILRRNRDFRISIVEHDGGIALEFENAPAAAFKDGQIVPGVRQNLVAVLRDLAWAHEAGLWGNGRHPESSAEATEAVFRMLRNAGLVAKDPVPDLAVCWGGHALDPIEYDYARAVGHALGSRGLDVCTGGGSGAMKGATEGALLGHAGQRTAGARLVGVVEPTIMVADAPNPFVRELVVMPDVEKRLEAFVRLAHGIVVFPGGVGTAEELLYVLSILLSPGNEGVELPLIVTGPAGSEAWLRNMHAFIGATLGSAAQERYSIVVDDPEAVAQQLASPTAYAGQAGKDLDGGHSFNRRIDIPFELQQPFEVTHESMAALELHRDQPVEKLAVQLRRVFSGIGTGNVREMGVRSVRDKGPFVLHGERDMLAALDRLLADFANQRRMASLDSTGYVPCYEIAV